MERFGNVLCGLVFLAGCSSHGSPAGSSSAAASASAPIAAGSTPAPAASAPAVASAAPTSSADVAPAAATPACPASLAVEKGQSFDDVSRRCYGSRAYHKWLAEHDHHKKKKLAAGETIEIPTFETLVSERLAKSKWKDEAAPIAEAFEHYRNVQAEIEDQMKGAKPGTAAYKPSAHGTEELQAAAKALEPVVAKLKEGKVHTKKFAQAYDSFEKLASGTAKVSTDYGTEDIHQDFEYGVDALR